MTINAKASQEAAAYLSALAPEFAPVVVEEFRTLFSDMTEDKADRSQDVIDAIENHDAVNEPRTMEAWAKAMEKDNSVTEGGKSKSHFNSNQVRIADFKQRLISEGKGTTPSLYSYEVSLDLKEAEGVGFSVINLKITAEGNSIESVTQNAALRMFLDAIVHAVEREKAGIRPGMPSPPGFMERGG